MTSPSLAAQVIVAIIPIVGIVIGGTVVFFYLLWRHKQVIEMIKSGNYQPVRFNLSVFCLLTGLLLICIGLALTILFAMLEKLSLSLLGGLIPLALGVGLLCFYFIYYKDVRP